MNESSVFTLLWHGKLYTEKKARNSGKKKIISDYSSVLSASRGESSRVTIHIFHDVAMCLCATAAAAAIK